MVKHTHTIRRQFADEVFDVLDHFVGLALKGISGLVFKALKTGLICKGNPVHSVSR